MAESGPWTPGQLSFLLGFEVILVAWLHAEWLHYKKAPLHKKVHSDSDANLVELENQTSKEDEETVLLEGGLTTTASPKNASVMENLSRFLRREESFFTENRRILRATAEFGGILVYFYLCDRTEIFPQTQKSYSQDLFVFLYLLFVLASGLSSLQKHHDKSIFTGKPLLYLNRHQTEEWKGWMQVLFLMYHYFAATELYNAIRVFIAAYVWMSGFGNFSYYYYHKDFSLGRFAQMMWRLNFFVAFCCIVLSNDYMLYYICPLHTLVTLMVYATIGVLNKYNEIKVIMIVKFIACFSTVIMIWEVPGVFETIWSPLTSLVGYKDPNPRKTNLPLLHEWHFRSGLDRYIWIVGMLYAYFHPNVERLMERLEETEPRKRRTLKTIIVSISLLAGYLWYRYIYQLDKLTYNKYHPYTSWIPITVYLLEKLHAGVTQLFPNSHDVAWENHIRDLHIPVSYLAEISYRIFQLVNVLKVAFVPTKNNRRLLQNLIAGTAIFLSLYCVSSVLLNLKSLI